MYGTCDGIDIIFIPIGRDEWETIIPADLEDGMYVVEIYAETDSGYTIYYAGTLYMSNGKVISLVPSKDGIYAVIMDNRTFAKRFD